MLSKTKLLLLASGWNCLQNCALVSQILSAKVLYSSPLIGKPGLQIRHHQWLFSMECHNCLMWSLFFRSWSFIFMLWSFIMMWCGNIIMWCSLVIMLCELVVHMWWLRVVFPSRCVEVFLWRGVFTFFVLWFFFIMSLSCDVHVNSPLWHLVYSLICNNDLTSGVKH